MLYNASTSEHLLTEIRVSDFVAICQPVSSLIVKRHWTISYMYIPQIHLEAFDRAIKNFRKVTKIRALIL